MSALYVQKLCSPCIVLFDGYAASTKDSTHLRRSKGIIGNIVNKFDADIKLSTKKDFLSNSANKQTLIFLLRKTLQKSTIETIQSHDDADVLIVKTAVQRAAYQPVIFFGEDTDLLNLLCHHVQQSHETIFFRSDIRWKKGQQRVWDIQWLQRALGDDICKSLLFVYALT